ncbi:MAG: AAA+ family ATPase, partial [Myxococcota bacterium]
GDHVSVKQLAEDFARYLYLPRLRDTGILLAAIRDGVTLLTWEQDSFAFADSYDEESGRYRGLRRCQKITLTDADTPGLLVRPEVARQQFDAEAAASSAATGPSPAPTGTANEGAETTIEPGGSGAPTDTEPAGPRRFHGSVQLDPTRVGRDAGRIAEEVLSHLSGLVGAKVKVTLEVEAEFPDGAPQHVVRTVTENSRTLRFTSQGFEEE